LISANAFQKALAKFHAFFLCFSHSFSLKEKPNMGLLDYIWTKKPETYTDWITNGFNYLYERAPDTRSLRTWASDKWDKFYEILPNTKPALTWASDKWDSAYAKLPDTKPTIDAISNGVSKIYDKIPDTKPVRNYASDLFWGNRKIILGSVVITVALLALGFVLKKFYKARKVVQPRQQLQPQQQRALPPPKAPKIRNAIPLKMQMDMTHDVARVTIKTPKIDLPPPRVTLTFCIDKSGSMENAREAAVKEGVSRVLQSAQRVVDTIKGSSIEIAIVAFNDTAEVILQPTRITPTEGGNNSIAKIEKIVKSYQSGSGTKIINGLRESITQLTRLTDGPSDRDHHLILLSDGDEPLDGRDMVGIHHELEKLKANFHAIGIGENHKKETLQKLASSNGGFVGTYIDTSDKENPITIEEAIEKIYNRAISPFKDMKLSTKQLEPGSWKLNRAASTKRRKNREGSECEIGSLMESTSQVSYLKILVDKIRQNPFDLKTVKFDLTYEDPKGNKGKQSFSWNPNPLLDTDLIRLAKTHTGV